MVQTRKSHEEDVKHWHYILFKESLETFHIDQLVLKMNVYKENIYCIFIITWIGALILDGANFSLCPVYIRCYGYEEKWSELDVSVVCFSTAALFKHKKHKT